MHLDHNAPNSVLFSLVINTRNEVENLARAIDSVSHPDEIIVVDMGSTDGTDVLAEQLGATLYRHKPVEYVEPARAFAVNLARNEWVLVLDADEELSENLALSISRLIHEAEEKHIDAYLIPRKNLVFGKWIEHAGWWPDYQLRLFRKSAVQWSARIHQPPSCEGTAVSLPKDSDLNIIHHHYDSIDEYLERLSRYTAIEAKLILARDATQTNKNLQSGELTQSFMEEYNRRLFAQHGLQSGLHGEALTILQSFYQSLTLLRIWEANGFPTKSDTAQLEKSLRTQVASLNYWLADCNVTESSGIQRLMWRLRRKFRF